jgi:heme/copper-type cytochrome/quinol oxidase subunit 2
MSQVSLTLAARRAYCIANRRKFIDTLWVIILHTIVGAAVALTASGAAGANKTSATAEQREKSLKHVKVGMIMLLLSWLYICLVAVASLLFSSRRNNAAELPFERQGRWLLYTVVFALPFVGIRIIASLVYFTTQNQALNPVTGELGYKIGLNFIEELIISVSFVLVGVATRNIGKGEPRKSSRDNAGYPGYPNRNTM